MKKTILAAFLLCSLSGQAQFGGLLSKAKDKVTGKAKAAITPDGPTDGVTSPMHQKYMNKIVFAASDEGLAKGAEKENLFLTKFTLGDPLVFRVYMDNSLCNYLKGRPFPYVHGQYQLRFLLDGVETYVSRLQTESFDREAKEKWTTWRGAFKSPDGEVYLAMYRFNDFIKASEEKLTIGDHKVTLEIMPLQEYPETYLGPVVASGEITMSVKKSVIDASDPAVCMPKAKMTDKVLEAKILAASKRKVGEGAKDVRISSAKWNIARNKITGIITRRTVEAYIGFTKNGKCYYDVYDFHQDYDGTGYQDEVYLEGEGIGTQRDISCKCLKP